MTDKHQRLCERKVVGTETVEAPDPAAPTVTIQREIVEWECPPSVLALAGAGGTPGGGAGGMSGKVDYVRQEAARDSGRTGHICHAKGCSAKVPPAMFMCKRHWFMVPTRLRNTIWCLYEPGREITKDPTNLYVKAALEAIEAVAVKEAQA